MAKMRAVQIVDEFGIDNLRITEVEDRPPGPGEVAVRVRAVSLNYRDLLVAAGQYSKKLPRPLTICSDAGGEVMETGAGVTRVKVGDPVGATFMPGWIAGAVDEAKARSALGAFAAGVLAERIVVHEGALVRTPVHLNFDEAATLPCAAVTAWNALFVQGNVKAGDSVLVLGSGGVSLFALQFACLAGAHVIATTSSNEKAARLREIGAVETINYVENPDWEETVRKLSGGGVDHVIEIGGAATLPKSIRAARMGANVYLIGNRAEGATEFNPVPAFMKSLRLIGVFVGSREMFESMNRAIAANRMRPVVGRVFSFDAAVAALRYFESGQHFGKVVIRCH
jgi:NADPH:quinone reductase-like Zn-dependent oxidoreductase